MNKRSAQNALNILLSDRVTFKGTDFPVLLEVVRDLQGDLDNGNETNAQSGTAQEPPL